MDTHYHYLVSRKLYSPAMLREDRKASIQRLLILLYSYQTTSSIKIPGVAAWYLPAVLENIFLGVQKSSDNLCKTSAEALVITKGGPPLFGEQKHVNSRY